MHARAFKNLEDLPDTLHDTAGDGIWDAASEGFFYTKMNANDRPSQVYYHRLGTRKSQDRLIFREEDPGFFISVYGSLLNDFIFIETGDHETSEIWLIPAREPQQPPRLIKKREEGVEYSIVPGGDVFYIRTNRDGAEDFKIMTAPAAAPILENWKDFIPHEKGRLILDHDVYHNHLVWLERKEGLPRILVFDRNTGQSGAIAFDEETYSLSLLGAAEYKTEIIRFSYSSMTTPDQVFDYNMASREKKLLKMLEVPCGHNSANYITRRLMAPAPDGETVPISLLYHKNTPLDGSAPCLLYGYGAYGVMDMALMALRFRQVLIPTSFPLSIAALFMPLPISAAARIKVFPGMRMANINTRSILLPILLRPGVIWSGTDTPRMSA